MLIDTTNKIRYISFRLLLLRPSPEAKASGLFRLTSTRSVILSEQVKGLRPAERREVLQKMDSI